MNIACFLVTEEGFEKALLPEELLVTLVKSLREKGKETVHLSSNKSILVDGIYIPAKDSQNGLMLVPNMDMMG